MKFANFDEGEQRTVCKIVDRAYELLRGTAMHCTRLDLRMDLSAVHARCPLRLGDLLEADAADFAHDITGIVRHLDRKSGKLGGCFLPRFSANEL